MGSKGALLCEEFVDVITGPLCFSTQKVQDQQDGKDGQKYNTLCHSQKSDTVFTPEAEYDTKKAQCDQGENVGFSASSNETSLFFPYEDQAQNDGNVENIAADDISQSQTGTALDLSNHRDDQFREGGSCSDHCCAHENGGQIPARAQVDRRADQPVSGKQQQKQASR